jgi:hypothetical protein
MLDRLSQAERMLAEIATAEDAAQVVAFAEAARVWAQQARLGTSAVNHATVIKMRAERRMADAVDEGQRSGEIAKQGRPKNVTEDVTFSGQRPAPLNEVLGTDNPDSAKVRLAEARKIRDNYTEDDLLELEQEANAADEVLSRKELVRGRSNAQRMQSSESNEWYTPAPCIEAARRVLGSIDLDPASSEQANGTVRAERFYSLADDGLAQPWVGTVWLNPPYGGKGGSGRFVARLVDAYAAGDVTAAVCLVSSHSADTEWFRPLWDHLLCFSYGRIPFISSSGEADAPTHGSVFAYLGKDWPAFAAEFGRFGAVVARWQ